MWVQYGQSISLMNLLAGVVALASTSSLVASLVSGAPIGGPADGDGVLAAISTRNVGLESFTFHANVAMAMRHFPWLHFHVQGTGDYRRGDHYFLRLSNLPFSSGTHQIDLSMIDTSMWADRYRYRNIGANDGDALFALQSLHDSSLKSATVAVSPSSGAHWVDASYADGTHIHMTVGSGDVRGFLLPSTLDADVDRPHMPLSAAATFSDYVISSTTP